MKQLLSKRELLQQASMVGVGLLLDASSQVSAIGQIDSNPKSAAADVEMYSAGTIAYDALRRCFNKRIDKYPKQIALCKSAAGVQQAIRHASSHGLQVTIKSGGHSFEGFSCNDGGIVINLSKLNRIQWLSKDTIRVGPGVTLSKLYDTLLPHGCLVPAGSCGGVGIGGLALGGGYGFFARNYGLTCDSLVDVTVVDGNGQIRKGSQDPELLWACRGAGTAGLAVVTDLVFKTHPAPESFRSYRFKAGGLDEERAATLLQEWFKLSADLPTSCFSAFVLNGNSLVILVTDFKAPSPALSAILTRLGKLSRTASTGKPQNLATALKIYYGRSDPLFFRNSSGGLYKGYDEIRPFIKRVLGIVIKHPGMMYQVNTLGGNINSSSFETGSCYPHRSRPFLSELQAYWSVPSQGDKLKAATAEIHTILRQNGITAHYANYPSLAFSDWQHDYYGQNYPRIQAVKRKYDPSNLFRFEQSIRL